MAGQPDDPRNQLLQRAPVAAMADLLYAVGDSQAILSTGLCLALHVLDADRGLAFGEGAEWEAVGFSPEKVEAFRQRWGSALLLQGGVHYYAGPDFLVPAEHELQVAGMAGVIPGPGTGCVFAVERERVPFDPSEQAMMGELLRLLERPFRLAPGSPQSWPALEEPPGSITADQLPFDRLEPFPQSQEVERLLIQEAMIRWGNNKTAAAAALGMTREGLRKKMVRLGIPCGERMAPHGNGSNGRAVARSSYYAQAQ